MGQQEQTPGGGSVCGRCGMSFETQDQLDRHVRSEHAEDDEKETAGE